MADSNRSAVSVVAIIAIVILVGVVIYFVMEETNDTIEIDLGGRLTQEAPTLLVDHAAPAPPAVSLRSL
jgi:hypothetical protein